MRRRDKRTGNMFFNVDLEAQVPPDHPSRVILCTLPGTVVRCARTAPEGHAPAGLIFPALRWTNPENLLDQSG